MTRPLLAVFALCALFLSAGCVTYEYDLVRPQELSRRIPAGQWTVAALEPLEYRLQTVDNHLVVQVWNHTPEPVQLLGDRSVVVDPKGESHPLRTQTIAPESHVKLILPAVLHAVYPSGPTIGIGVGVGVSNCHSHHHCHGGHWYHGYPHGFYDPFWNEPRYYAVYAADGDYWEWDGDAGEARVVLVFDQGGKTFTHELAFKRRRV